MDARLMLSRPPVLFFNKPLATRIYHFCLDSPKTSLMLPIALQSPVGEPLVARISRASRKSKRQNSIRAEPAGAQILSSTWNWWNE
eukprot:1150807-Pelagomonas_calceolata.AAC.5